MCGDYNSVLGMEIDEPLNRFITKIPRQRFEPATGPATISGLAVDIDDKTVLEPDVVLVPLLAFDAQGFRLGYGGGFYDRTLARLRAIKPVVAVGVAYDELKVDAVPHRSYDERLDWVLTPSGPQRCSGP
jgi:5-formyltetrahydrofolate cyclo-ligase